MRISRAGPGRHISELQGNVISELEQAPRPGAAADTEMMQGFLGKVKCHTTLDRGLSLQRSLSVWVSSLEFIHCFTDSNTQVLCICSDPYPACVDAAVRVDGEAQIWEEVCVAKREF